MSNNSIRLLELEKEGKDPFDKEIVLTVLEQCKKCAKLANLEPEGERSLISLINMANELVNTMHTCLIKTFEDLEILNERVKRWQIMAVDLAHGKIPDEIFQRLNPELATKKERKTNLNVIK